MSNRQHLQPSSSFQTNDQAVRELRTDLHNLLSPQFGSSVPREDRWGSHIANPSHSRHHSELKENAAREVPSMSSAKSVHFGEAGFVTFDQAHRSPEQKLFQLHDMLGSSNPVRCDFISNPTLLATRQVEAIGSKLDEPALTAKLQPTRIKQMTIIFSQWEWEIIVSTPATPCLSNKSSNAERITALDVLECIYLHLSEPVREDAADWERASTGEKEAAWQSLAKRRGRTLRRIDWLGGDTLFAGLEYVGGATCSEGGGADGGRWMVLFRRGILIGSGARNKRQ